MLQSETDYVYHPQARPLTCTAEFDTVEKTSKLFTKIILLIAALMTFPLDNWMLAAAYSGVVGAMAATAWLSRFPRYRVGLGAVLFVVSDLFIFSREAGVLPESITSWLIWPLYFGGQFLIATGVVQTLRGKSFTQRG